MKTSDRTYYFTGDEFRAKKERQSYTVSVRNEDGVFAIYDSVTPEKMRELVKEHGSAIDYVYNDVTGEFIID